MITSFKGKVNQRLRSNENTRRENIVGILHDIEVGKDCGQGHVVLQQTQKLLHSREMTLKNVYHEGNTKHMSGKG